MYNILQKILKNVSLWISIGIPRPLFIIEISFFSLLISTFINVCEGSRTYYSFLKHNENINYLIISGIDNNFVENFEQCGNKINLAIYQLFLKFENFDLSDLKSLTISNSLFLVQFVIINPHGLTHMLNRANVTVGTEQNMF